MSLHGSNEADAEVVIKARTSSLGLAGGRSLMSREHVIVVGGGLAGLSTAHTILEQGGRVLILDKSAFLGGNSTKATSGINGALTQTQIANGIKDDSREIFYEDAAKSAGAGCRPPLVKVLTYGSGPAVEWLQEVFGVDLSKVAMMGGHSHPRCHRGKERFPGAAITMQLMEAFDAVCEKEPERAQLQCKARVTKLLQSPSGDDVIGVEYEKDGQTHTAHGPVVLSSGGFGAFCPSSPHGRGRALLACMRAWGIGCVRVH